MTRREALRQTQQEHTLFELGFTREEAEALRRIALTLHRWHERECGDEHGCIERDESTGQTFWLHAMTGRRWRIPDRETGAVKRLNAIIAARNARIRVAHAIGDVLGPATSNLSYYIQGDPRGAPLYLLRPGDVADGQDVHSAYYRGLCVY